MTRCNDLEWILPEIWPHLREDEVHVWRATLAQPASVLQRLWEILDEHERERMHQRYSRQEQERFIASRGLLRVILSRYLRIEPAQLHISYNSYGKPLLAAEHHSASLYFNVSHSGDLALYTMTYFGPVGIDIEQVQAGLQEVEIAEQFFSPFEVAALRALPPHERTVGFLNGWTRKEAYIKARGQGLSLPLNTFTVSLAPNEPAKLLAVAGDNGEETRWTIEALNPGSGYIAALAIQGHPKSVCLWHWYEGAE